MKVEFQIHSNDKKKPWIVLINGLFASLELWEPCIDALKPHFQILRYNCQGQGLIPEVKHKYLLDDHVKDLHDLLSELRIEKAHLLGISNGGRIALKFASLFPETCHTVIATDTYDKLTTSMSLKIESWLKAQDSGDQELRFDISTPWIFGESFLTSKKDQLDEIKKLACKQNKEVVAGLIRGALEGEIDLKSIETPVLFLVGEEDVLTPIYLHQRMHQKTKNSKISVIKGGHASLYEFPENIDMHIIPFLKDQSNQLPEHSL